MESTQKCPAHSAYEQEAGIVIINVCLVPTYVYLPRDGEMRIYNDMLLLRGDPVFNFLIWRVFLL